MTWEAFDPHEGAHITFIGPDRTSEAQAAHDDKVRAALDKIKVRDAELLRRLAKGD